jgi:hypothetical protein
MERGALQTEGEKRAEELALRYGLPKETIFEAYRAFQVKATENGWTITMRLFEAQLRVDLAQIHPDVKNVEPLYCKGLDPLHPYNPSRHKYLILLASVIALIALGVALLR